jgi:hypothetical protein
MYIAYIACMEYNCKRTWIKNELEQGLDIMWRPAAKGVIRGSHSQNRCRVSTRGVGGLAYRRLTAQSS